MKNKHAILFYRTGVFQDYVRDVLVKQNFDVTMVAPGEEITHADLARCDLIWCDWADQCAVNLSQIRRPAPLIVHVCSYEAYVGFCADIQWHNVTLAAVTAQHIADNLPEAAQPTVRIVPDCIDLACWPQIYRPDSDWTVGIAGTVQNTQKNVQFAVQLAYAEPKLTVLIRGPAVDKRLEDFIDFHIDILGPEHLQRRLPPDAEEVFTSKDMNAFYEECDYILSASYHESTHRSLLEGMAKGCMPLVQNRLGVVAPEGCTYNTMSECLRLLREQRLRPAETWRRWVVKNRSIERQDRAVLQVIDEALSIHSGLLSRQPSTALKKKARHIRKRGKK